DADVVLIEPPREDYEDFFSNIFSFSSRRAVCEHAYDATRKSLLARHGALTLGRNDPVALSKIDPHPDRVFRVRMTLARKPSGDGRA
ncbi:MAG: hypothetical protein GY769_04105, partial [bacterium]|nr:hypothetical protein [bacterium]